MMQPDKLKHFFVATFSVTFSLIIFGAAITLFLAPATFIGWEYYQKYTSKGTFEWKDVEAGIAAQIVVMMAYFAGWEHFNLITYIFN